MMRGQESAVEGALAHIADTTLAGILSSATSILAVSGSKPCKQVLLWSCSEPVLLPEGLPSLVDSGR